MTRLSVVIPCRNAGATLLDQLNAVASQSWDQVWEVIVVDDGSTDASVEIARGVAGSFVNFQIVQTASLGPAGARNVGVQAAQGEYIAFCDADDVVAPGWLAAIGDAVIRDNFVAGLIDSLRLNDPEVARVLGFKKRVALLSSFGFLPHALAANMAVRRDIHEQVGGFDPTLRAGEDADFCWRVQLAGTPLKAADEAIVFYRFRSDLRGLYRQGVSWAVADVYLHRKYDPQGMPPLRISSGVKGWMRLSVAIPGAFTRGGRLRLAKLFGYRVGRLKGGWKYRYPTL